EVKDMVWEGTGGVASGANPSVTLAMESPRHVYAVRLRYRRNLSVPFPSLRVQWGVGDSGPWTDGELEPPPWVEDWTVQYAGGQEKEECLTFWVDGRIDRLRILPDRELARLQITHMTLLLPEPGLTAEKMASAQMNNPN